MTLTTTEGETLLLKQPTVGQEHIAFLYAGDIWIASRDGSNPRRFLTAHGAEADNIPVLPGWPMDRLFRQV